MLWAIYFLFIDAHRGGGGGISCPPSKDFEKLDYKNVMKHENRGSHPRFSHNPPPLEIIWKWLCIYVFSLFISGWVLLFWRQHLQGQVLAEARQEEQGGVRLTQTHLFLQETQTSYQGLETSKILKSFDS